jgi:phosphatidylserine/phosphatidylglycerophosphate/cardiolipin synthase-like enzyme
MTIRLVDKGWAREITDAVAEGAGAIRLISPFIKAGALRRFLSPKPTSLQVITRFNLQDFADGVSDITALRMLLDAGASVRGVKNLHSKLYLFGSKRAIVTSANLTEAAWRRSSSPN